MTHPERIAEIRANAATWYRARDYFEMSGAIETLLDALTASEKRAETARDDALEEAAKVAAAHDADQGIKKLGPSNFRMASEEARMAMRDEARGERIASEMIAKAIRAMKGQR